MDNKQKLEQSADNFINCLLASSKDLLSEKDFDLATEQINYAKSIADVIKKLQELGVDIGVENSVPQEEPIVNSENEENLKTEEVVEQ